MLVIPIVYNEDTREIAVSEEWAGTCIDSKSTQFIVSGIPDDVRSAKLDVKVAVRSAKGKVRPFLILKGIESGTGSAVVPSALLNACKRDLKFIFQLEMMNDYETVASKNWITLDVSPTIFTSSSNMDEWNQDQVLIDAYEVSDEKIVFKRFNGDEFAILLKDNPAEWANLRNVPWRSEWSTGTPTDKDILVESFIHGELDKKTDILTAIPEWTDDKEYIVGSTVVCAYKIFQSKKDNNIDKNPLTEKEWWEPISSDGKGGSGSYNAIIGDGSSKEITVNHNLGTDFFTINLLDRETKRIVDAEIYVQDDANIVIKFFEAPAADSIQVTIIPGSVSSQSYFFQQVTPADVWNIKHNLGRKVMVQVFKDDGTEMDADIQQLDNNDLVIRFYPVGTPTTGFVVVA